LAVGTNQGYRIYSITTLGLEILSKKENKEFELKSGISCISILSETRWLAFSTDGSNSELP